MNFTHNGRIPSQATLHFVYLFSGSIKSVVNTFRSELTPRQNHRCIKKKSSEKRAETQFVKNLFVQIGISSIVVGVGIRFLGPSDVDQVQICLNRCVSLGLWTTKTGFDQPEPVSTNRVHDILWINYVLFNGKEYNSNVIRTLNITNWGAPTGVFFSHLENTS